MGRLFLPKFLFAEFLSFPVLYLSFTEVLSRSSNLISIMFKDIIPKVSSFFKTSKFFFSNLRGLTRFARRCSEVDIIPNIIPDVVSVPTSCPSPEVIIEEPKSPKFVPKSSLSSDVSFYFVDNLVVFKSYEDYSFHIRHNFPDFYSRFGPLFNILESFIETYTSLVYYRYDSCYANYFCGPDVYMWEFDNCIHCFKYFFQYLSTFSKCETNTFYLYSSTDLLVYGKKYYFIDENSSFIS